MIHVLAVRSRVREPLQTLGTLEGLFAGVQTLVLGQMVLVLKSSWALFAFVWPLSLNNKKINKIYLNENKLGYSSVYNNVDCTI